MNFLKSHPFAVEAFFENSTVLTFAAPKEELEQFIPECLSLDTFENKWAFIAVAMVQTSDLRPKGFPKFLGKEFFLIGYRIFVRYRNSKGKSLRGLYILKSETNRKQMEFLGNLFTRYSYTTTDIKDELKNAIRTVESKNSGFKVELDLSIKEPKLPVNSPFADWRSARKFAGPLPHTFTFDKKRNRVLIIRGLRQNWTPQPVSVKEYRFNYLENLNLKGLTLANAFEVKNIPYHWEKGKFETWK